MDKKPIVLAVLLVLILIVAYAGFIATAPAATSPAVAGQVKLEVTGPPSGTSSATGMVGLTVVK
jgi:hypothetical protein